MARAHLAAGLTYGDRIAIWAPNIWEWVVVALGAQSIGVVLIPLNTRFKGAEAADILERGGVTSLFVTDFLDTNYIELLQNAGAELPMLKQTVVLRGEGAPRAVLHGLSRGRRLDFRCSPRGSPSEDRG